MNQALFITIQDDPLVDYLEKDYLTPQQYFRFNTDHLENYRVVMTGQLWSIQNESSKISAETVGTIWYRNSGGSSFAEALAGGCQGSCLGSPWIFQRAENRLVQLRTAQQAGLQISETLVTNDSSYANQFCLSSQPARLLDFSVNQAVKDKKAVFDYLTFHQNLKQNPCCFRKDMQWEYSVIAVLAWDSCYAVKTFSQEIDWELQVGCRDVIEIQLPQSVKESCLYMMKELQLSIAAVHFNVSNGTYYFMELGLQEKWIPLAEKFGWDIGAEILQHLGIEGRL